MYGIIDGIQRGIINSVVQQGALLKQFYDYVTRVLADAGLIKDISTTRQYMQMAKSNGILDSIKFAWLGEAGYKQRTSGINTFWTKLFSLKTATPQARRNLLTYTEEFDNAAWIKGASISVTPNVTNSPYGILSADKITTTIGSDSSTSQILSGPGIAVGIHTFSVYLWSDSAIDIKIKLFKDVGSTLNAERTITLTTTPTRYTLSADGANTIVTSAIRLLQVGYIYAWGAQLEVGSSALAYQRVIDANSWDGVVIDATKTTSTNQPYLSGNIAPNEKWCLKNPNGGDEYMTHPTISFAANEAWSVTTVLNFNNTSPLANYCGNYNVITSSIGASGAHIRIVNKYVNVSALYIKGFEIIGKNTILTIVYNADNRFFIYANGVFKGQITMDGSFDFSDILKGREYYLPGSLHAHIIRAQALTPTQVAAEANFLRSLYPEIPSVTIGSQVWATSNCEMVATPQGNLIANVTANANVEKNTDVGFDSSVGWTISTPSTLNVSNGVCNYIGGGVGSLERMGTITQGKYYRIKFTIAGGTASMVFSTGGISTFAPNNIQAPQLYPPGTYDFTLPCLTTTSTIRVFFYNNGGGQPCTMDNWSIVEYGWSGSTELYDAVYAATSGTDEQKTYAAVKAAAMWRYPNNDSALGAIYNKLYNDYAMKLLAMDIAYYNTANPSTPWGWDIPLESDWTTLQTTVNNNAEALKKDGTVYWSSPNAGTNSSLFTALPAGYVKEDGTFAGLNNTAIFASKDNMDIPRVGKSIRLIKR